MSTVATAPVPPHQQCSWRRSSLACRCTLCQWRRWCSCRCRRSPRCWRRRRRLCASVWASGEASVRHCGRRGPPSVGGQRRSVKHDHSKPSNTGAQHGPFSIHSHAAQSVPFQPGLQVHTLPVASTVQLPPLPQPPLLAAAQAAARAHIGVRGAVSACPWAGGQGLARGAARVTKRATAQPSTDQGGRRLSAHMWCSWRRSSLACRCTLCPRPQWCSCRCCRSLHCWRRRRRLRVRAFACEGQSVHGRGQGQHT